MLIRLIFQGLRNATGAFTLISQTRFLHPHTVTNSFILSAIILICVSALGMSFVRWNQWSVWADAKSETYLENAPLFSTTDAAYFLRDAKSIIEGESLFQTERIRSYPNFWDHKEGTMVSDSLEARPLPSWIIAKFAGEAHYSQMLLAANLLLIATAALTAVMISVCFGAAGYWLEGAIAGLGGGLSAAYLTRTSIGRIDTDQLNLGFLYLLFGLLIFAGKARSRTSTIAFCLTAGVIARLFMWWYYKPAFVVVLAIVLAFILICLQRDWITATFGTLAFVGLSGIGLFSMSESPYVKDVIVTGQFIFPNTFSTISEIQIVSFTQILHNTVGSDEMGLVCLTGLALFLVRHPVIAVAYGPLVAFGLLNFVIGNRAIFYSAPIMWFGAAFLMTTTARFIAANLSEAGYIPRRDQTATVLAASLAMLVAWVNSPTDYVPSPSFEKPVLEGLASLKETADRDNSVVATWWDYGYASMFFNDLPTFHDGGSQTTPTTHFVATAFLDADQARSIGNLKFLSTKGHAGIATETSLASLRSQFDVALDAPSPDLYLVVTDQMAGWISSISQIGNWDIETGTPITPRGNNTGPEVYYEPLNCRLTGYPQSLTCASTTFDLESGLVNGVPTLAGWAHAQDGSLVRSKNFDHDGHLAVQIVQTGNRIDIFLLHRQLYESTFNELYHLGVTEHPSLSLHYDDYPHIRIYKVEGEPVN